MIGKTAGRLIGDESTHQFGGFKKRVGRATRASVNRDTTSPLPLSRRLRIKRPPQKRAVIFAAEFEAEKRRFRNVGVELVDATSISSL